MTEHDTSSIRHEYSLLTNALKDIGGDLVPKCYGLWSADSMRGKLYVMVMDDFGDEIADAWSKVPKEDV